jgi:helix-turn-helix protein
MQAMFLTLHSTEKFNISTLYNTIKIISVSEILGVKAKPITSIFSRTVARADAKLGMLIQADESHPPLARSSRATNG